MSRRRLDLIKTLRFAAICVALGLLVALGSAAWWAFSGQPRGTAFAVSNAWDMSVLENNKPNATVYSNRLALARSLNRESNGLGPTDPERSIDYHNLPDRNPPVPHMLERFGTLGRSTDLFDYGPFDGYVVNSAALTDEDAILEYAYGWPRLTLYSRERVIDETFHTEHGFTLENSFLGHTFPYGSVTIPTGIIWRGLVFNAVFFGVCLYATLLTLSAVRRLHRYTRGRCPRCAYDLRHDFSRGCSECGWRKEHAFQAAESDTDPEAQTGSA